MKLSLPNVIAAPPTFISELNCEEEGICKREDWLDTSRRIDVPTRHIKRGLNPARRVDVEAKIGTGDREPIRASKADNDAPKVKPKTVTEYLDQIRAGSR